MELEYEQLKIKIENHEFRNISAARYEISKSLVRKEISNEEHCNLRTLLDEKYE